MSRVTKTSTPTAMQVTAILLLVVQNTPALLDVQSTLVLFTPCWLASAKSNGVLPIHNHRAHKPIRVHKHMGTQPTRSRADSETLSGYWDIYGFQAHCLLDSGCKGVMISPDFIRATGIIPLKLEQPIGLQLACGCLITQIRQRYILTINAS